MADIIAKRQCAELEGDFVVFLIGMRINKPWKVDTWLPVALAMPRMLAETGAQPELGLLHAADFGLRDAMVVQYWRSDGRAPGLRESARRGHLPAWQRLQPGGRHQRRCRHLARDLWSAPAGYENIYVNMPPFGLGKAGILHKAVGREAVGAKPDLAIAEVRAVARMSPYDMRDC